LLNKEVIYLIKNNIPKGKNQKVLKMGQEVSIITKTNSPIKVINGKKFFLGCPRKKRKVFGKLVIVGLKKSTVQLHEGRFLEGRFLEGVKNDRITVTA